MKTVQRLAILFACVLLVSTTTIVASRRQSPTDWLLIHNRNTQAISILNPETKTTIPLAVIPHNDIWIQWVSPNGKWLYFFAQYRLWAYSLLTDERKEIFECFYSCIDSRPYVSSYDELTILIDGSQFRRLKFDTATFLDLEVDMSPVDTTHVYSGIQYLTWLGNKKWMWVRWNDGGTYRVSYDGKIVEQFDARDQSESTDGKWTWKQEGNKITLVNLDDSTQHQVPALEGTFRYLHWTPENTLMVRYVSSDSLNTIVEFKGYKWTTLIEDKLANGTLMGLASPISPNYENFLFFEPNEHLYIANLKDGTVTYVDQSLGSHIWNDTGEWFVYPKNEDVNQLSIYGYDVVEGIPVKLHEFSSPGRSLSFYTYPQTDYVLLDWERLSGLGSVVINVKTGQTLELDPNVYIISKWNVPDFEPPHYNLHILIGLLLLSMPLAAKVARRKLSA